ncbi:transposase [Streptomyces sp. NBC_01446]|uniref:Transposase n=1 Tax=Streptomyces sp. NBC_00119 TaxID=2975659 RepID=A0AAU1UIZ1_9ACTN|nr:transposase [Streptomyces sp. NBC_01446]MCX4647420.1 transposase [Streptomyces sp. NBC_01446]
MIRAYKFLLRPTARQEASLRAMLAAHCSLYNGALQERRDAYAHSSQTKIKYGDQSAQLKDIRTFDPERQGRWSFSSQQSTLRRLNVAFVAFFKRAQKRKAALARGVPKDLAPKAGYPRFKGVGHFDTVTFPKDGDGCRWDSTPHDTQTRVRLQGVGHVRVHQHRPVRGRVKTVSVKREGRKWFVIITCDQVPAEPLPATGANVGIDMGITHFLTTSQGEHVPNPRFLRASADELAAAQRVLETFPKKTRRRTKKHRAAAGRVAKIHAKIRRQRLDHHHKRALDLVRDNDVIGHEALNTAGMTKTPAPKPDPDQDGAFLPNGAAAKAGLNKSILDASWGLFLGILANKAESAGRRVIPVDARNTSRTCPPSAGGCGHVAKENRVTQTKFECVKCGFVENADTVGALNVEHRAGLALCAEA